MAYVILLSLVYCVFIVPYHIAFYLKFTLPISVDHCKQLGLATTFIDWVERYSLLTLAVGEQKILKNIKFSKPLMFSYWTMTLIVPPVVLSFIVAFEKLDEVLLAFGYVPMIGVCTISSSDFYLTSELVTFYLPLFGLLVLLAYKWKKGIENFITFLYIIFLDILFVSLIGKPQKEVLKVTLMFSILCLPYSGMKLFALWANVMGKWIFASFLALLHFFYVLHFCGTMGYFYGKIFEEFQTSISLIFIITLLKVRFSGKKRGSLGSNGSETSTISEYNIIYTLVNEKKIFKLLGKKLLDNIFLQLKKGKIKKSDVSYIAIRMRVVEIFNQESLTNSPKMILRSNIKNNN